MNCKCGSEFNHYESINGDQVTSGFKCPACGVVKYHSVKRCYLEKITDEALKAEMIAKVNAYLDTIVNDLPAAIKELTPRGKGGKIKTNKPKNGVYAYIWRMCRFHCGDDVTLPMTATFDLSYGIDEAIGVKVLFAVMTPETREMLNKVDAFADSVLKSIGLSDLKGAARWGRAMGLL